MAQNFVNCTSQITSPATSPVTLLARCLVLDSMLPTTAPPTSSGFCSASPPTSAPSWQPADGAVGSKRSPLLLHYLDQHFDLVEAAQWQDWLLALVTDTVTIVHYLLFLSP